MFKLFNLEKFKSNYAFIYNGKKIRFSKVLSDIKRYNKRIKKNSIIFVLSENTYSSILSYLISISGDNIVLLLDAQYDKNYIDKMIKEYCPNYIFFNSKKKSFNGKIVFELEETVLVELSNISNKNINFKNFLLLTTSGTTSNPKVVRLSRENIIDNTKKIISSLKIKSDHTTITTLPFSYSYGLSILNSHFFKGACLVVNNLTVFEKNFWKVFDKYKVNSFGGVPQLYKQLRMLKFPNKKYPHLKYLTQAGGKLSDQLVDYFYSTCKKNKIKFIIMYGQTEASPRISFLPWKDLQNKKKSIGTGMKGYRLSLVDKNKKIINKTYSEGELVVRGKNIFLGYANNYKDLFNGDVNNQILYTGDYAFRDNQGFFYITGRKSRFAKLFGFRINLDDIENILKEENIECKVQSLDEEILVKITKKKIHLKNLIKNLIFEKFNIPKKNIHFEIARFGKNLKVFKK